jgi:hypothetical protein
MVRDSVKMRPWKALSAQARRQNSLAFRSILRWCPFCPVGKSKHVLEYCLGWMNAAERGVD